MNKSLSILIIILCLGYFNNIYSQINVGGDFESKDTSALFEIQSTNRGFLLPRMTSAERDLISDPAIGLMIYNTTKHCIEVNIGIGCSPNWNCLQNLHALFQDEFVHCDSINPTKIVEVTSSTGRIWMDRNLGASQVAQNETDTSAYGSLFQWGRYADGHQCLQSIKITTSATTSAPNNGNVWDGYFIINASSPFDWLSTSDSTLWASMESENNPCPSGYRLPRPIEWAEEIAEWDSQNSSGAFSSALKLPLAGYRDNSTGTVEESANHGLYWTATTDGQMANYVLITSGDASLSSGNRAKGLSIRCIKE